jgi:hypothetical protein
MVRLGTCSSNFRFSFRRAIYLRGKRPCVEFTRLKLSTQKQHKCAPLHLGVSLYVEGIIVYRLGLSGRRKKRSSNANDGQDANPKLAKENILAHTHTQHVHLYIHHTQQRTFQSPFKEL